MPARAHTVATFVAHPDKAPPRGFATQIMKKANQSNAMPLVGGVSQLKPQECPSQWPKWANSLWCAMQGLFVAPLGCLWAFLATFPQMANSLVGDLLLSAHGSYKSFCCLVFCIACGRVAQVTNTTIGLVLWVRHW